MFVISDHISERERERERAGLRCGENLTMTTNEDEDDVVVHLGSVQMHGESRQVESSLGRRDQTRPGRNSLFIGQPINVILDWNGPRKAAGDYERSKYIDIYI